MTINLFKAPLVFLIFQTLPFILQADESATFNVDNDEFASEQNPSSFLKKEYCLTKPFQGQWDFSGSTVVTSDFIRLTPDSQSHQGSVWSTVPVRMRHWEVQLHFRVHGSTGNLFGDGMAFWYVDPATTKFRGPVFGVQDQFRGLAVLLDTYSNHNGPHSHDHPYISAMVNNGSRAYDHDRDGTHSQLTGGCTAKFRNREHDTRLAIRYVDGALTVATDIDQAGKWLPCFRVDRVQLPTHFVFGVSAMTGDLSDNHDVLAVKVFEVEPKTSTDDPNVDYRRIEPSAESAEAERPHIDGSLSGGGWTLLRIFLVIFFVLLGIVVLLILACVYHSRQQRNRKRFY